jgi:predicted AAA+ superfamily ATPase
MVIVDLIKQFNAHGLRYTLSFFRDSNKNEIDLIIEVDGKTIPVEIKSSETVSSKFFDTMTWFQEETHNESEPIVIYCGDQVQKRSYGRAIPWTMLDTVYPGV